MSCQCFQNFLRDSARFAHGSCSLTGDSSSVSGFLGVVGPLVTANGLVGDVYLDSGDPVTIAVQMMNIEPYFGAEVDWWVVAFAHADGWYYFNSDMQWTAFNGELAFCRPVYQGALFNLPPSPVWNGYPSKTDGVDRLQTELAM